MPWLVRLTGNAQRRIDLSHNKEELRSDQLSSRQKRILAEADRILAEAKRVSIIVKSDLARESRALDKAHRVLCEEKNMPIRGQGTVGADRAFYQLPPYQSFRLHPGTIDSKPVLKSVPPVVSRQLPLPRPTHSSELLAKRFEMSKQRQDVKSPQPVKEGSQSKQRVIKQEADEELKPRAPSPCPTPALKTEPFFAVEPQSRSLLLTLEDLTKFDVLQLALEDLTKYIDKHPEVYRAQSPEIPESH